MLLDHQKYSQAHLASLAAQTVKNPPVVLETRVLSLGQEDPLEKGTVTHSSILGWRIPWTEEPGGLQFMGSHRVGHNSVTNTTASYRGTQLPTEPGAKQRENSPLISSSAPTNCKEPKA